MPKKVTIKEAADKLELTTKTIRFYEDIGVIPKAKRNKANYRIYSTQDIKRIEFVKKSRYLGFSLDEIKNIINIKENGDLPCCTVIDILERQKKELEYKVREMIRFKSTISQVLDSFKSNVKEGEKGQICGLIENLFNPDYPIIIDENESTITI